MDLDLALEAAFQAAWYVDYRQTMVIASNPDVWYERNPLLGAHPTPRQARGYFIAGAIVHPLITYTIPQGKYRTAFQAISLGVELGAVQSNIRIGLRF